MLRGNLQRTQPVKHPSVNQRANAKERLASRGRPSEQWLSSMSYEEEESLAKPNEGPVARSVWLSRAARSAGPDRPGRQKARSTEVAWSCVEREITRVVDVVECRHLRSRRMRTREQSSPVTARNTSSHGVRVDRRRDALLSAKLDDYDRRASLRLRREEKSSPTSLKGCVEREVLHRLSEFFTGYRIKNARSLTRKITFELRFA